MVKQLSGNVIDSRDDGDVSFLLSSRELNENSNLNNTKFFWPVIENSKDDIRGLIGRTGHELQSRNADVKLNVKPCRLTPLVILKCLKIILMELP